MLTNILNTLAITCSLGASINQAPQPNRAGVINSYTITKDLANADHTQLENIDITGTEEDYTITRNLWKIGFSNTFIQGRIITLQSEMGIKDTNNQLTGRNGTYQGLTYSQVEHVNGYNENDTIYVAQRATYIEIDGANTNVDVKVNISRLITMYTEDYMTGEGYTTQKRIYTRVYKTNSTKMNDYINYDQMNGVNANPNKFWYNNNLYDRQTEIIYGIGGYTSTLKEKTTLIENQETITDESIIQVETENEIEVNPGKKNYYIIYEEVQYKCNPPEISNGSNMNVVKTTQTYGLSGTIEITGKNVVNASNQEIVNIPGIMFQVLGMPFTFISTAFNLTLFPGTPYELNISLLLLSLIAVLVFIFLIKFLLGKVK